jgi:hypothetical protein
MPALFEKNQFERNVGRQEDKANAKAAKTSGKEAIKRSRREEKRQIIREKKQNQEGVYKKIGPFTIKTYITLAIIIAVVIMALVQNKEEAATSQPVTPVQTEKAAE